MVDPVVPVHAGRDRMANGGRDRLLAHLHPKDGGIGEEAHGPVIEPPGFDAGRLSPEGIAIALSDGAKAAPAASAQIRVSKSMRVALLPQIALEGFKIPHVIDRVVDLVEPRRKIPARLIRHENRHDLRGRSPVCSRDLADDVSRPIGQIGRRHAREKVEAEISAYVLSVAADSIGSHRPARQAVIVEEAIDVRCAETVEFVSDDRIEADGLQGLSEIGQQGSVRLAAEHMEAVHNHLLWPVGRGYRVEIGDPEVVRAALTVGFQARYAAGQRRLVHAVPGQQEGDCDGEPRRETDAVGLRRLDNRLEDGPA